MDLIRFIIGFIFIISIAYLLSSDKRNINWRLVLSGIVLQLIFAILITKVPFIESIFSSISKFFVLLIGFSKEGTLFLFPDASFNGFAFSAEGWPSVPHKSSIREKRGGIFSIALA